MRWARSLTRTVIARQARERLCRLEWEPGLRLPVAVPHRARELGRTGPAAWRRALARAAGHGLRWQTRPRRTATQPRVGAGQRRRFGYGRKT